MVLTHKPDRAKPWDVFIAHSFSDTAKHFAINFGAPGDMKDEKGMVWFGYPNPETKYAGNHYPGYGIKFDLNEQIQDGMGYYYSDIRSKGSMDAESSWLIDSGCIGMQKFEIPLVDQLWGEKSGHYTVRLGFSAQMNDKTGQRIFDVMLQGETVLKDFEIVKEANNPDRAVIKEFKGIKVNKNLLVEFSSKTSNPSISQTPIINFIEVIREDEKETPKVAKAMDESSAESLLASAKSELNKNNGNKALEIYHEVYDNAPNMEIRYKALEGMASIGSEDSLSRIAIYCKEKPSILWDYKLPPQQVRDSAVKTCVSIANNLATSNKQRAIDLLSQAMGSASEPDVRQQVVDALDKLGVKVESKKN